MILIWFLPKVSLFQTFLRLKNLIRISLMKVAVCYGDVVKDTIFILCSTILFRRINK